MMVKINIKDGYELEFIYDNVKYTIELYDFVEFLRDYYADDYICNSDGLCDLIDYYASTYDLIEVIRLVEELDAYSVSNNEFIVLDATYYYCSYFNDFTDIGDIYDISDVVENIASDLDHLEYYCTKES